ncbi:hypothetical protein KIPB_013104, partial [Kipferlia bialata]|eukprot:g13104.t1
MIDIWEEGVGHRAREIKRSKRFILSSIH